MAQRRWAVRSLLFITVIITGIAAGPGPHPALAAQTSASALVRAGHLVPGAPPADIWLDDDLVFGNVAFATAVPYRQVAPRRWQLWVTPAGQRDQVLFDAAVDLTAGSDMTVLVTGTPARILPLVLTDDPTAAPEGRTRVRFVHAAPDIPPVDIVTADGNVLFHNVGFRDYGGYTTVPAGVGLTMHLAGDPTALYTLPTNQMTSGATVTLVATGTRQNGNVIVLALNDQSPPAGTTGPTPELPLPHAGTGGGLGWGDSVPWQPLALAALALFVLLGSPIGARAVRSAVGAAGAQTRRPVSAGTLTRRARAQTATAPAHGEAVSLVLSGTGAAGALPAIHHALVETGAFADVRLGGYGPDGIVLHTAYAQGGDVPRTTLDGMLARALGVPIHGRWITSAAYVATIDPPERDHETRPRG
jgi:hypothetical protein